MYQCLLCCVLTLQGLQIHGNEPSPLFNEADPYWYVYANDTKFIPRPGDYAMIDSNNLVMHNWTFNKTAWVLRSQVGWVSGHVHVQRIFSTCNMQRYGLSACGH